jgi:hypothetical protein
LYTTSDYAVKCYTPKHKLAMVYAGIMVVVYPVGIPLMYACVLYRERKLVPNTLSPPTYPANAKEYSSEQAATTEFLWEPYHHRLFWWEICECLRRLLLTGNNGKVVHFLMHTLANIVTLSLSSGLLAFILPNSAGQSAVACALAFFTILVYEFMQPHKLTGEAMTYTLGAAIVFVTMFTTLLTQVKYTDDQSGHVISILLIAMNLLLALMALTEGVRASRYTYIVHYTYTHTYHLPLSASV